MRDRRTIDQILIDGDAPYRDREFRGGVVCGVAWTLAFVFAARVAYCLYMLWR